jgi:hypothetical protein
MKTIIALLWAVFLSLLPARSGSLQNNQLVVTVKNDMDAARASETVVLSMKDISTPLQTSDWKRIRVADQAAGQELVTQGIDMDGDGEADLLLFQSGFKAGESRSFTLKGGEPKVPAREQFKAYGRFVRERCDDFAWENDRIAHRMYGAALETYKPEPLTSSAVDVWVKRVRRLVINDWYMVDNYHVDTGEGADLYSAGASRGCGGSGIWDNAKLFVSRNFINSKVIANGPIRVVFELTYAPWDANGHMVSEVKRLTLDAGQNFDRFESYYKTDSGAPVTYAIGIKKGPGSNMLSNREEGWMRTWEPLQKGQGGNLGCGIIIDPAALLDFTEGDGNYVVVAKTPAGQPAVYYAGFGWDRSGDFSGASDWDAYVRQFVRRVSSPLKVSISSR